MKIALLLGLGFSRPADMPNISDITNQAISGKNIWRYTTGRFYLNHNPESELVMEKRFNDPISGNANRYYEAKKRCDSDICPILHLIRVAKDEIDLYYQGSKETNYEDIYYFITQLQDAITGLYDNPAIKKSIESIRRKMKPFFTCNDSVKTRISSLYHMMDIAKKSKTYIKCIVKEMLYREHHKIEYLRDSLGSILNDSRIEIIDIFTLNHDHVVEDFLKPLNIKYADGFGAEGSYGVRYWNYKLYDDESIKVRLFKLHGSIDWDNIGNGIGIRAGKKSCNIEPVNLSPIMLIGTFNKMIEYTHGIFAYLYYQFRNRLPQVNHLIICGYGFGDRGINNTIIEWFESDSVNKVIVIEPDPEALKKRVKGRVRNFLFPETLEEEYKAYNRLFSDDPTIEFNDRPKDQPRKWDIIKKGIQSVQWDEIQDYI